MSIEYKSTATLINELITARLKIQNIGAKEEFIQRTIDLQDAITKRNVKEKIDLLVVNINKLAEILEKLWWEQEVLYQAIKNNEMNSYQYETYKKIAQAGVNSLLLNKERSELTRLIDEALGEKSSTPLEKSWK